MKWLRYIFLIAVFAILPQSLKAQEEETLDMQSYIFGHIQDSYDWHITDINDKAITIPLPVILYSKETGINVFMSHKLEEPGGYKGFRIAESGKYEGKIVEDTQTGEQRPFDLSMTKNVCAMLFASILLIVLMLSCASWYRKHDVTKEAPSGLAALLEPVIVMINDEVIKDAVGKNHAKYAPYLLTAFFFILINNLLGLFPTFPGGGNVTGNIAVTLVLALFTFFMVNLFGTKHYYKEIFWPDVPIFLKAIPIMPIIEIVGTITKPFSLMIRLFANILAGHIMILSAIAVIFLTAKMGAVVNGSLTVVAVLFGVFLDFLEILVAFIQAYVFTMLSAVFIGMAQKEE